jgi:hypothetical protein
MREFVKDSCLLVGIIAIVVAAVAWLDDRPDPTTWLIRALSTGVGALAFVVFGVMDFKKDWAPDLLRLRFGDYFDRNGFCFIVTSDAEDARCILRIFFQNRNEGRCQAKVAIRSVKFVGPQGPPILVLDIDCPGGAYGHADQAIGLPLNLQGKKVKLDVGADVIYPDGKGCRLRFKNGTRLRRSSEFVDLYARTTTILGFFAGKIVFHKPPRVAVVLPNSVATQLDENFKPKIEILWQPTLPSMTTYTASLNGVQP